VISSVLPFTYSRKHCTRGKLRRAPRTRARISGSLYYYLVQLNILAITTLLRSFALPHTTCLIHYPFLLVHCSSCCNPILDWFIVTLWLPDITHCFALSQFILFMVLPVPRPLTFLTFLPASLRSTIYTFLVLKRYLIPQSPPRL